MKKPEGQNVTTFAGQRTSRDCQEIGGPLVNAEAIGSHYNVTGRYILKLAAQGRIPCVRLGKKCVRFRPADVALAIEGKADLDPRIES